MSVPFRTQRRVEFGDTDMAGIAHFANFFRYMEAAETDFWHSLGMSVAWAEGDQRFGLPRVSAGCDYVSPARFEDVLDIDVTVEKVGTKSFTLAFGFSCRGRDVARGRISCVYCEKLPDGRMESREIPEGVREKLPA